VRRRIIAMLTAAFLIIPGFSVAQMHGGGEGQHNLKSPSTKASMRMMQDNMGLIAEITDKMQQMMSTGLMSPEQQGQITNMMKQMSRIMREMAVPHGEQVKKSHNHELQKMRKQADAL
jgi:hypothetical protein